MLATREEIERLLADGFSPQWYRSDSLGAGMYGMSAAEHFLFIQKWRTRNKAPQTPIQSPYERWVANYDTITASDIAAMKRIMDTWETKPTFSIIMPVYNTTERLLREAIRSVINQAYGNWELCIANDCSTAPHVRSILDEYAARDSRIKVVHREANGHISEASNSAIEISTGEWLALFDHDDVLRQHALFCMAEAILRKPGVRLLYSDEDKLTPDGNRDDPYFKCDWNLELFRSHNLITHLGVYHRSLIEKIGGFRSEFNGAQDYDLALRCIELIRPEQIHHVPHVLYHWRMTEGSTALGADEKPYAMLAGERAINEHYRRTGTMAEAKLIGFGYRTVYDVGDNPPLVSIIIPTRNAKELVEQCVTSILGKTNYRNYEVVLVDNGSDDPDALAYFAKLSSFHRFRVIRDDRPFNYSALNNNAVQHCAGEYIILLNNDTEVISHDWLATMIGHAMQPGVGAVGAKLLYPDESIQHAGVVIGIGGVAGHVHHKFGRNDAGFKGRLALANEYSAVTAACLAVKKEHFLTVGGLNETDLTVAFNDVDLCLKLASKGLRNIYTPFAELFHHESATRGYEHESPEKTARFEKEQAFMKQAWPDFIAHDHAYNPNLTLNGADFAFAPPRVKRPWE